ncbi:DUF2789 domain-containing protein, partial [Listeria monocytogenes]|nr:DUF2789 domain-containing protein [Listeria monocytogenes]
MCDKITHPRLPRRPCRPAGYSGKTANPGGTVMDTSPHTFSNLFRQLGLPAGRDDIVAFLARHHLEEGTALPDAPFWNPAQA